VQILSCISSLIKRHKYNSGHRRTWISSIFRYGFGRRMLKIAEKLVSIWDWTPLLGRGLMLNTDTEVHWWCRSLRMHDLAGLQATSSGAELHRIAITDSHGCGLTCVPNPGSRLRYPGRHLESGCALILCASDACCTALCKWPARPIYRKFRNLVNCSHVVLFLISQSFCQVIIYECRAAYAIPPVGPHPVS